MRSSRFATLAAAAVLVPTVLMAWAPGASASDASGGCGSPLGVEAERGANAVIDAAPDPEYSLIDTLRMPGAQRSPETIVNFGGRLVLVAEVKVDQAYPNTNFTWGIFVRFHSNETGWNTSQIWVSSPNTTSYYPAGVHIRPSAVTWRDRLWVLWDSAGSEQGGPNDRLILLRSVDANGTAGTTLVASNTDPLRANEHPFLLALPDKLVLVYASAANETDPSENHIVYREFDGAAFSSSVCISNVSDGWTDGLPLAAADPAGGLYLVWSSSNQAGSQSRLMFSRGSGNNWTAPVPLATLGHSPASIAGGAFYNGRFYAAYATDNIVDINGTDYEVFWRNFDPTNGAWSAPSSLNPQPSNGDDLDPDLRVIDGLLYASWSTDEDAYYSHGSDPDPVYRLFNGTQLGPLLELSSATDRAYDGTPHFVKVGGHLYAHWMWQAPPEPGAPRGDAREAIRLVERPSEWYDNLVATYTIRSVSENGSSEIVVWVWNPSGDFTAGTYVVRLPDGSTYPLSRATDGYAAWAPVERDTPDFEVLACGKALSLSRAAAPPMADPRPLAEVVVVLGLCGAAFAIGGYVIVRRRRG